jgi:hypothetical protein
MERARVANRAVIGGVLVCAGVLGVLGGCAKPLLSPTEERSPFDRFDALRAQAAPQVVEDEYGRAQPNLRARLGPKD